MSIREESDIGRLLEHLGTHPDHGLSRVEAYNRLRRYGTNELERPYMRFVMARSAALFCLAMGIVLALEAMLLYAFGILGMAVCLMCLASALRTRYRRETVASTDGLPVVCSVIRNGRLQQLPVYRLVPGDIVRIQLSEVVPADGRLTEAVNLVVQEKILSGNPEPVAKDALCADASAEASEECRSQVFMGTIVVRGRGAFVVTATGARTRIGKARILARKKRGQPKTGACDRTP